MNDISTFCDVWKHHEKGILYSTSSLVGFCPGIFVIVLLLVVILIVYKIPYRRARLAECAREQRYLEYNHFNKKFYQQIKR